jgi:hypothetical protein
VAINNPKPSADVTISNLLQWTRAKSNIHNTSQKLAASSHGRRNRRQFKEIDYIARIR